MIPSNPRLIAYDAIRLRHRMSVVKDEIVDIVCKTSPAHPLVKELAELKAGIAYAEAKARVERERRGW